MQCCFNSILGETNISLNVYKRQGSREPHYIVFVYQSTDMRLMQQDEKLESSSCSGGPKTLFVCGTNRYCRIILCPCELKKLFYKDIQLYVLNRKVRFVVIRENLLLIVSNYLVLTKNGLKILIKDLRQYKKNKCVLIVSSMLFILDRLKIISPIL